MWALYQYWTSSVRLCCPLTHGITNGGNVRASPAGTTSPAQTAPVALVCAALLVPTVVAAGTIWLLRTTGSPEKVADSYLSAWAAADYDAMKKLVAEPSLDFERTHRLFLKNLKAERASFTRHVPNGVFASTGADTGEISFQAVLSGAIDWTYGGRLRFVERDRTWKIAWTPAAIHPDLTKSRTIRLIQDKGPATPVLAADGSRIDTPDAPGSVQQLVEGMKQTYPDRFGAYARAQIDLVEGGDTVKTLHKTPDKEPLRTTIDLKVHRSGPPPSPT